MDKYIGMDMDSKKTVICVVQQGKADRYTTVGSDVESLRRFLRSEHAIGSKVHAAFEVGGQAGWLYDQLIDVVDSLHVANPTKMTWIFRTAKKNDRIDARKMAILLSINELPTVYMPTQEVRQWRQLILHRQKTVQKVAQVKNQIRSLLKSVGIGCPGVGKRWWTKQNRCWMVSLCETSAGHGVLWRLELGGLLGQLGLLERQRDEVTGHLDAYLDSQAGGKLLQSIRGVGPRTAEAVLAYTDDIRRFGNYKEYCAYFGLTPKLDESGSTRRLGHISKQGPGVVRWALTESSWKVIRYCPSLKAFYERVMAGQKGRKKIAIVAVARKLLCIMRAMLISGELYNDKLAESVLKAA